ncbi:MAG: S-adenosylmethionine:tRNA ribosyltransferase-isomerase [Bradymonadia bacterium]|jgi:S-adenosylmethionine:tRNA ribosyltransferase-isomerase
MKDLLSASAYDYVLPEELVAAHPATIRTDSRLLDLSGPTPTDRTFFDLLDLLRPGDLLVVNDAKVSPVRLAAKRATGGAVEVFVVGFGEEGMWRDASAPLVAMIRSNRRVQIGETISVGSQGLTLLGRDGKLARFSVDSGNNWDAVAGGDVPLPPYIVKRRKLLGEAVQVDDDLTRYQTVFAREPGAVAAPTAGLHFTNELLTRLEEKGISRASVTLFVGIGTFEPVQTSDLRDHHMHVEHYAVPQETVEKIRLTRAIGGRVVAVGTTVVRTLESAVLEDGELASGAGSTSLFITPGYRFQLVDAMVTNFHLPRSTLMALVAAFAGHEPLMRAYAHAVERKYRFYSYGDSMFLTRKRDA